MIRLIRLKGFQAHEDLTVELDPVTVLVGPNDAGKSTVIRALRWVAFNRPLGDEVIRHGLARADVRLVLDDCEVWRIRGPGNNVYRLRDSGKRREYRAFGRGVPDEVAVALRLGDVNFQRQIDPPFWLTLPPADAAREMNRVVDLEVIDRTLASASLHAGRSSQEVRRLEESLSQARVRAGVLSWLDDAYPLVEHAGAVESSLEVAKGRTGRLSDAIGRVEAASERLRGAESRLSPLEAAAGLLEPLAARLRASRVSRLECLISTVVDAEARVCRAAREITELTETLRRESGGACPACGRMFPSPSP